MIRSATNLDAPAICAIYNDYVVNTTVTFEETPVTVDEMSARIDSVTSQLPWYVFEMDGKVVGYAYATPWRARSAYRFSVESTVYVSAESPRRRIGSQLYSELIEELQRRDIRVILGGIALPNVASVALHEKFGFEKVAHLKKVGWKFGRWIDVGYWELEMNEQLDPSATS